MSRNVTVFSLKTKERKVITTSASTWGELENELKNQGLDTNGMKATHKENRTTFESSTSALPSGDFTVILTPTKVKSGAIDFEEEINKCKTLIASLFTA